MGKPNWNTMIDEGGMRLCIGLDPDVSKLPGHLGGDVGNLERFCIEIIDACSSLNPVFKLNFAFFEQYGIRGIEILKKTFDYLNENNLFSIADAKRGDIGNSSKAYAEAVFNYFNADSVTVSPYMGTDSIQPFFNFPDKSVFVLAVTSNPGSKDFQKLKSDDNYIYSHVIKKFTKKWDKKELGFVAGATSPEELLLIRQIIPDYMILVPGVGAQGGDLGQVRKANSGGPCLVNSSRGIIYSGNGKDFAEKVFEAARRLYYGIRPVN